MQDEGIQDAMDAVRGRFKAAAAMLGLQDVYTGSGVDEDSTSNGSLNF